MITILCSETEKNWILKALEHSPYGCPKVHGFEKCITKDTEGCLSSTFYDCIQRQIEFKAKEVNK